uniref:V-set and immunoglobulin domain containing 8 n=1 Tax=Coturnix japonica TaxID=93934 RepID=A0A8C2TTZ9_COTJA
MGSGCCGHRLRVLTCCPSPPALLLAVRINSKGRRGAYLPRGTRRAAVPCEEQGMEPSAPSAHPHLPFHPIQFLSYHDHHVNYGSGSGLQDRVAFVQNDPGQHDASIRLADLQVSDTGTYQCRVKKNTVAVHEVIVTVQEKPATPQCWTEGDQVQGGSVLLRCYSRGGAAPLAYQWAKLADGYGGGRLPHGTIQGRAPGDLLIRSVSEAHAGVYQCRVSNRVGYATCQITLSPSQSEWHQWGLGGLGVPIGRHQRGSGVPYREVVAGGGGCPRGGAGDPPPSAPAPRTALGRNRESRGG